MVDLNSTPWAPACVLSLHLMSGRRDPMASCTPHELLRIPRVPELCLAPWTAQGAQDASTPRSSPAMTLGGFIPHDGPTPLATGSATWSTKQGLGKLVDGDSMPIDVLSQFEAAIPAPTSRGDDTQLRRLTKDHRQVCEKLQALEDAVQTACRELARQKWIHHNAATRLQARIHDL